MMKKREREEPCPICQHYHDYLGGERCTVCGHTLEAGDVSTPSALPTEVIPGFLFVGSFDHASRSDLLQTLAITHIVNTVPTCPSLYKNSFTYFEIPTNTPTPSLQALTSFLDQVKESNNKVLVHCMSGNSRSPTLVLCYLMRTYGWKLDYSYEYLKSKRPSIAFNDVDAERAMAAEAEIFGEGASGFQLPVGKVLTAAPAPPLLDQPHNSDSCDPVGTHNGNGNAQKHEYTWFGGANTGGVGS